MLKEATISKQKIVNTFTELSEESSLEQINTTDIIKKVSLSRPTFYYYSNQDKVSSILQKYMTYQKGVLTEMLRYLKENHKLCRTLMTHIPNINELICEFIIETILNYDIENVTELMERSYHIPVKYSSEVYVITIVTILALWLKEGCIESPEGTANTLLEAVIIKAK
jgi:ACT domain-containing protein